MEDIIVCVKQVPNTTNVKLDPKDHTLIREGIPNIINPHDEFALDAALDCKNRYGVKVAVVTMGPPQAKDMLIHCMEKGADEGFLLTDRRLAGSDTLATSRALAALIRKTGYRNVFCGQESIDSSTGHIGPSLAELLCLPQITYAKEILDINGNIMHITSEYELGHRVIELELPAVISFNKSSKDLRKKVRNIRENKIKTLKLEDIEIDEHLVGLKGSPTFVVNISVDEGAMNFLRVDSNLSAVERIKVILSGGIVEKKGRIMLKGGSRDTIAELVDILRS
jgi:electron transfer flavoprotein beta subunit